MKQRLSKRGGFFSSPDNDSFSEQPLRQMSNTDKDGAFPKRVLSGMRPSGRLHLGHLLGALENWRRLQQDYECFYFVADWHALTTEYADTGQIKENTRQMVIDWLAGGVDPEKSTIFVQSHVPEHAELHVLLSMITPLSWLERVPTYKEQQQELSNRDLSTYGFLGYPLLQSADIMIYKANLIPVGLDQLPHIEFTREVVRRFNFMYGELFPLPEPQLGQRAKLPGTDGRKMSKSYGNCINLSDPPQTVTAKVKQMFTDPARARRTDPGNPDICPVYSWHEIYSPRQTCEEIHGQCPTARIGCVDCKEMLARNLRRALAPIYERRCALENEPALVEQIIRHGAQKARRLSQATRAEVRRQMGLAL